MKELKKIIEETYENKNKINLNNLDYEILQTIFRVIKLLNNGIIRISEKKDNTWITHEWLKKAVLLYIYIKENKFIEGSYTSYYDKVPLKYEKYNEKQFKKRKSKNSTTSNNKIWCIH